MLERESEMAKLGASIALAENLAVRGGQAST